MVLAGPRTISMMIRSLRRIDRIEAYLPSCNLSETGHRRIAFRDTLQEKNEREEGKKRNKHTHTHTQKQNKKKKVKYDFER